MTVNADRVADAGTPRTDRTEQAIRVTGHRGAMAHAPENTALSLVTAEQLSVDEIELDVRLSSDGVAVISHDDHLGRVLGVEDAPLVSESTWAELQTVQLPRGQRLLTFQEVLQLTSSDLQVELKAPEAAPEVARLLRESPDDLKRCVLTSFQAPILAQFQELLPDVPRGLIAGAYDDQVRQQAVELDAYSVLLGWGGVTAEVVRDLQQQGFFVAVWPVRDLADAQRAVEFGVDQITADAPGAAREWIDAALSSQ